MKTLAVLLLVILSISCSKPKKKTYQVSYRGKASVFKPYQHKAFGGIAVVESSLLNVNGEIIAFYDPGYNSSFAKASLGVEGNEFKDTYFIEKGHRFSYVMQHQGTYYDFSLVGSGIYLWKSTDLVTWAKINNGQPVLNAESGTVYQSIWNVGVAVDDQGVWHLLVECADGTGPADSQGGVGLCYSNATMANDQINFDANKSASQVIPHGGNPYLAFIPGKGLLAVHGQLNDPHGGMTKEWYITASTMENGGTWTVHKQDFQIGVPRVHVCYPAMVETSSGNLLISLSVDQHYIATGIATNFSLDELFDLLTN